MTCASTRRFGIFREVVTDDTDGKQMNSISIFIRIHLCHR